jgi:hypothetical protein
LNSTPPMLFSHVAGSMGLSHPTWPHACQAEHFPQSWFPVRERWNSLRLHLCLYWFGIVGPPSWCLAAGGRTVPLRVLRGMLPGSPRPLHLWSGRGGGGSQPQVHTPPPSLLAVSTSQQSRGHRSDRSINRASASP